MGMKHAGALPGINLLPYVAGQPVIKHSTP